MFSERLQKLYSRRHTGQHSPSRKVGLAQATGGHVIWWHTIFDSCGQHKEQIQHSEQKADLFLLSLFRSSVLPTWQVHLVQLSTTQSSLSSKRRPSCQHMRLSLMFFMFPSTSFITVFSSVWPTDAQQDRQMDSILKEGNTPVNVFHVWIKRGDLNYSRVHLMYIVYTFKNAFISASKEQYKSRPENY